MHSSFKVQKAKKKELVSIFAKTFLLANLPHVLVHRASHCVSVISSIQYGDWDGGKPVAAVAISVQVFVHHLRITSETKFELIHDVVKEERQNGTI